MSSLFKKIILLLLILVILSLIFGLGFLFGVNFYKTPIIIEKNC